MYFLKISADTRRFDGSESPSPVKDVNSSMSDSYQAALNVEVPLPGGLGFRPCLIPCFFQFAIAGCNKASDLLLFEDSMSDSFIQIFLLPSIRPHVEYFIPTTSKLIQMALNWVVLCRYSTTRREVLKLGSLAIGLGSSYFTLTHLKVRCAPTCSSWV